MSRINNFDFEKSIDEKVTILKKELKKIEENYSLKFEAIVSFKKIVPELREGDLLSDLQYSMNQEVERQVDIFNDELQLELESWND